MITQYFETNILADITWRVRHSRGRSGSRVQSQSCSASGNSRKVFIKRTVVAGRTLLRTFRRLYLLPRTTCVDEIHFVTPSSVIVLNRRDTRPRKSRLRAECVFQSMPYDMCVRVFVNIVVVFPPVAFINCVFEVHAKHFVIPVSVQAPRSPPR